MLYADLLNDYYMQSKTIQLPLSGDITIWVVRNAPFPPHDGSLAIIENAARYTEEFMGVPFPTTDIILRMVDDAISYGGWSGGYYLGTHMRVLSGARFNTITHETAHYYHFTQAPSWLKEGGAEFMVTYVGNRIGLQGDLGNYETERYQDHCLENLRHHYFVWGSGNTRPCSYVLGEVFLQNLFTTIGKEAMASAMRELYLMDLSGTEDSVEERIYLTFMEHTPTEKREDFRRLYRRLHGGRHAFEETPFEDDHADEAESATAIAVGENAQGTLDYMFDFDYFQFEATRGQTYEFEIEHPTLRPSSVVLYSSEEKRELWAHTPVPTGHRFRWVAPRTGLHYLTVHNFGGKTGGYSFRILRVDVQDDHGDSKDTATTISAGEVSGNIDDDLDLDYFRVQPEDGKGYYARVFRSGQEHCCVDIAVSGVRASIFNGASDLSFRKRNPHEVEIFFVVHGGLSGDGGPRWTGPYTFVITQFDLK